MAVDKTKDTKILNVLHSTVAGSNKLAHADEIYDEGYADGEKNQHDINEILRSNSLPGGVLDKKIDEVNKTLTGKIDAEVTRSTGEDEKHQAAIDANKAAITKETTDRETAVSNEAKARQDADTALETKIAEEATARAKADEELSKRIENINSAYQYVASVEDIDAVRNYAKTENTALRKGSVFNVQKKFTLDGKEYDAGVNVAINNDIEAGAVIADADIDPLGGSFDTSKIDNNIEALRKTVYLNHLYVNVDVNPSIGYKGEATDVALTFSAGIAGSEGLTPEFTVKKDGTAITIASGDKNSCTADADFEITAAMGGVSKVAHGYFKTFYPVYTFASASADIAAIPADAVKQPVTEQAAGKTYNYDNVAENSYLCIAVPDSMTINGGTSGGFDAGIVLAGQIAVDGKGNYKVYRTNLAQSTGSYAITFA